MYREEHLYALVDERDEAICYIGITGHSLKKRLMQHRSTATKGRDRWVWLRRTPVSIVDLGKGGPYEERDLIRKTFEDGKMLFNNNCFPRLTRKTRKQFKKLQEQWIDARHGDGTEIANVEQLCSEFLRSLKC